MNNAIPCRSLAALMLLLVAGTVRSEAPAGTEQKPAVSDDTETKAIPEAAEPEAKAPASPFAKARTLTDSALQEVAGREDVSQVINARNTSNVANNTVGDDTTTGTITFDGQAFANLNGLSVLSANTGNNVSINASMNVNVAFSQ